MWKSFLNVFSFRQQKKEKKMTLGTITVATMPKAATKTPLTTHPDFPWDPKVAGPRSLTNYLLPLPLLRLVPMVVHTHTPCSTTGPASGPDARPTSQKWSGSSNMSGQSMSWTTKAPHRPGSRCRSWLSSSTRCRRRRSDCRL